MSRFGPDPRAFFDAVYRDVAPWDIGEVQPDMASLLAEFPPEGPVLDLGCGTGDLSLHLARSGVQVLGIDFVEGAIEEALRRASTLPPELAARVEFHVADALRPTLLRRSFGAVVDSGFLHLFSIEQGDALVDELAGVLVPGGRLYLHEFAAEFPIPNSPRAVPRDEILARFTSGRGWRVLKAGPARFLNRVAPVPATIACVERLPSPMDSTAR